MGEKGRGQNLLSDMIPCASRDTLATHCDRDAALNRSMNRSAVIDEYPLTRSTTWL